MLDNGKRNSHISNKKRMQAMLFVASLNSVKMGTNKKASRFGVGCNRPLRLSGMTSGIIGVARGRNISEHLPCNALTCQATYQNRSLNWLNCRCPREKPPRSDIFGRPMKPSTAVENLSFFAHFFLSFLKKSNHCQFIACSKQSYSCISYWPLSEKKIWLRIRRT